MLRPSATSAAVPWRRATGPPGREAHNCGSGEPDQGRPRSRPDEERRCGHRAGSAQPSPCSSRPVGHHPQGTRDQQRRGRPHVGGRAEGRPQPGGGGGQLERSHPRRLRQRVGTHPDQCHASGSCHHAAPVGGVYAVAGDKGSGQGGQPDPAQAPIGGALERRKRVHPDDPGDRRPRQGHGDGHHRGNIDSNPFGHRPPQRHHHCHGDDQPLGRPERLPTVRVEHEEGAHHECSHRRRRPVGALHRRHLRGCRSASPLFSPHAGEVAPLRGGNEDADAQMQSPSSVTPRPQSTVCSTLRSE